MDVILINKKLGGTTCFTLNLWMKIVLSMGLFAVPTAAVFALLYYKEVSQPESYLSNSTTKAWVDILEDQKGQVEDVEKQMQSKLGALTLRVAELQARLIRLDALGERLTSIAKLESGEFDFSQVPAMGGPEQNLDIDQSFSQPSLTQSIDSLTDLIEDRQQQLATLEQLLANQKLNDDVFLAGRPIKKGWMSSRFGRRTDPFTGKIAWHQGVDFAGKEGADIISVAAGVVTASDDRSGYGKMVEVNHGNGFVTRYAHCKDNLVNVGDIVKKGQVIAVMGSTGRSTGPHVHFEVFKHGRAVDPASYIHRTRR